MKSLYYHTIDPLILQTLNLNERRMNHILDILHGRPSNHKQSPPKVKTQKNLFENSLRSDHTNSNTSFLFPQITKRNQAIQTQRLNKLNDKKYSTIDQNRTRKTISLQKNQTLTNSIIKNEQLMNNQLNKEIQPILRKGKSQRKKTINQVSTPISFLNFSKLQQKQQFTHQKHKNRDKPRNSLSAVRSKLTLSKERKLQSPSMKELSPSNKQVESILQQSILPSPSLINEKNDKKPYINYRQKTKQMINDYMGQYTLKKSKSLGMLNPKDIYRLQIENIIAQLTPIEKLQDSEKKMKRIKRRHQHLKQFDHKYYSKLNQMDLVSL